MKNTTMWARCTRLRLARSSGQISSIEAPVVPTRLASTAPAASSAVFISGVPDSDPRTWMPPVMTNSVPSRAMKDTYSWPFSSSWCTPAAPNAHGIQTATGSAQAAATSALLRLRSQKCGASSGSTAMPSNRLANGITAASGIAAPIDPSTGIGPSCQLRIPRSERARMTAGRQSAGTPPQNAPRVRARAGRTSRGTSRRAGCGGCAGRPGGRRSTPSRSRCCSPAGRHR